MKGVTVDAIEREGMAGVLWDARGTHPLTLRDRDVIYRLYHADGGASEPGCVSGWRGRCFVSEPQRPYTTGEHLMLETRDGQRVFGAVDQVRAMRSGGVALVLVIHDTGARNSDTRA